MKVTAGSWTAMPEILPGRTTSMLIGDGGEEAMDIFAVELSIPQRFLKRILRLTQTVRESSQEIM